MSDEDKAAKRKIDQLEKMIVSLKGEAAKSTKEIAKLKHMSTNHQAEFSNMKRMVATLEQSLKQLERRHDAVFNRR